MTQEKSMKSREVLSRKLRDCNEADAIVIVIHFVVRQTSDTYHSSNITSTRTRTRRFSTLLHSTRHMYSLS